MPRGNYKDVFEGIEAQEVYTVDSLVDGMNDIVENAPKRARKPVDENALVIKGKDPIAYKGMTLTFTGIEFEQGVTEAAMFEVGEIISRIETSMAWWIGDLLNAYENYGDGTKLAELIGLKEKTVYNYKWVCKRVKTSLRKEGLSFGHHALVAPLPQDEQQRYLELAEKGKDGKPLSVAQLRTIISPPERLSEGEKLRRRFQELSPEEREPFIDQEWRATDRMASTVDERYNVLRELANNDD